MHTSNQTPLLAGAIAAFTAGLSQCFSTALQLFDEVLIAPHLDPLGDTSKRPKCECVCCACPGGLFGWVCVCNCYV